MPLSDDRPALSPWPKCAPQGLRLRRFKRAAPAARATAPAPRRQLRKAPVR